MSNLGEPTSNPEIPAIKPALPLTKVGTCLGACCQGHAVFQDTEGHYFSALGGGLRVHDGPPKPA